MLSLTLKQLLEEIFSARIPEDKQTLLACRALDRVKIGQAAIAVEGDSRIGQFEAVLSTVSKLSGHAKPSVTGAKEWLRSHGEAGQRLASRVSRLSKSRNAQAHPDVGLLQDILELQPPPRSTEVGGAGSDAGTTTAGELSDEHAAVRNNLPRSSEVLRRTPATYHEPSLEALFDKGVYTAEDHGHSPQDLLGGERPQLVWRPKASFEHGVSTADCADVGGDALHHAVVGEAGGRWADVVEDYSGAQVGYDADAGNGYDEVMRTERVQNLSRLSTLIQGVGNLASVGIEAPPALHDEIARLKQLTSSTSS